MSIQWRWFANELTNATGAEVWRDMPTEKKMEFQEAAKKQQETYLNQMKDYQVCNFIYLWVDSSRQLPSPMTKQIIQVVRSLKSIVYQKCTQLQTIITKELCE